MPIPFESQIPYPGRRIVEPQPPTFTADERKSADEELGAIEAAERAARLLELGPSILLAGSLVDVEEPATPVDARLGNLVAPGIRVDSILSEETLARLEASIRI